MATLRERFEAHLAAIRADNPGREYRVKVDGYGGSLVAIHGDRAYLLLSTAIGSDAIYDARMPGGRCHTFPADQFPA